MSFDRRQFFLGMAAGFVAPSLYEQLLSYFENHGEPLLQAPRRATQTLFASSELAASGGYLLTIGNPWIEPEPGVGSTLRELANHRWKDDPEGNWRLLTDMEDDEPIDWDWVPDFETVHDCFWFPDGTPAMKGYEFIQSLDLGPQLGSGAVVGEIETVAGFDFLGVKAVDDVSLSLLQNRLNELRTGYRIELC
ncbi:MAG: hypothetical protein V2J12_00080 [Gammaproteobacteria bacterium]|jgi:hypothetical protein|nr:hypothetical protein [Gammaproteobacteria bacterium]